MPAGLGGRAPLPTCLYLSPGSSRDPVTRSPCLLHNSPLLAAAPAAGGSEGPFCVGINGSLFPSRGLPPPAPLPTPSAPPGAGAAQPGPVGLRAPRGAQGGQPLLLMKDQGLPQLLPWQRVSHAPQEPPDPSCWGRTTECVLVACPVYSSPVLLGLRSGGMVGRAREVSAGFPQGCRLGWVWVLVHWSPGDGGCTTPVFCKSSSFHLQMGVGGHRQQGRGDKWRGRGAALWLSQGGVRVLSVTSSAEPSLVFSQLAAARAGPGPLRDTTGSWQPQVGSWRQLGEVRGKMLSHPGRDWEALPTVGFPSAQAMDF